MVGGAPLGRGRCRNRRHAALARPETPGHPASRASAHRDHGSGSATTIVFGLLAWRIGTHLELLAYSGLAAVIALAARGSVGAADIRLAGLLGLALAWRGPTTLVAGTILALLYASLTGITLIILRRASRHTPIPFGPALIAGALTAVLLPLE